MNNDKLGVVVCCYNPDLNKLKKTLYSIALQENINTDIVIADDGSKLNYKEEILTFCEHINLKNVKCSFLEYNQGTINNVIAALKMLDTKYVKTISPGDYIYDENTLANMFDKVSSTDADVCFGNAIYYSNEKEFVVYNKQNPTVNIYKKRPSYRKINNSLVKNKDFILGASILYKMDKFLNKLEQLSKYNIKYCEDLSTLLLAAEKNNFMYVNAPIIWYEYGNGISTMKQNEKVKSLVEIDQEKFFLNAYPNFYHNMLSNKAKILMMAKMKSEFLSKLLALVLFPIAKLSFKFQCLFAKDKEVKYDYKKFKKIEDYVNGLSNN